MILPTAGLCLLGRGGGGAGGASPKKFCLNSKMGSFYLTVFSFERVVFFSKSMAFSFKKGCFLAKKGVAPQNLGTLAHIGLSSPHLSQL